MFWISGALIGGIIGGFLARRRKGNAYDIAHFVAVYAIAFALVGLIITVFVERALMAGAV